MKTRGVFSIVFNLSVERVTYLNFYDNSPKYIVLFEIIIL